MIRYIDIGDQILDNSSQFAWWDTVRDAFCEFKGAQVWDTWADFEKDFWPEKYLERFRQLYPLNLKRDNPTEKELVLEEE